MSQREPSSLGVIGATGLRASLVLAAAAFFCAAAPAPASAQQHLLKWNGGKAYERAHRPRPVRRQVIYVRERNANQDALVTAKILQMLTLTSLAQRGYSCPSVVSGPVACTANGGTRIIRVDTKRR